MIKSNVQLRYITASRNVLSEIEVEIRGINYSYEDDTRVVTSQEFYWALNQDDVLIRIPCKSTDRYTTITALEYDAQTGTEKEKIEKAFLAKINEGKWYASSGTDFVII